MALYDYIEQVTEFIKDNFDPATSEAADIKESTGGLLGMFYDVFPANCITTFELTDILLDLGYERCTWAEQSIKEDDEGNVTRIDKYLVMGWCLKSKVDLSPEEFPSDKEINKKIRGI